jgi:hypothetical protein
MGELCVVCHCWVDLPYWQWGAKYIAEFLLQAAKFFLVLVLAFWF